MRSLSKNPLCLPGSMQPPLMVVVCHQQVKWSTRILRINRILRILMHGTGQHSPFFLGKHVLRLCSPPSTRRGIPDLAVAANKHLVNFCIACGRCQNVPLAHPYTHHNQQLRLLAGTPDATAALYACRRGLRVEDALPARAKRATSLTLHPEPCLREPQPHTH